MHKSIIIFLLGSLVMLLPFASDNIFSKAIGIQDDLFKVYVKYKSDMANDYEEEYKSSSYVNNNNYKSKNSGMAQQGSPVHNQINLTNIYIMPGNLNNTANNGEATSIARCNEGDTVLSGSYFISFPYTEEFSVPSNTIVDFALPTQDGWETEVSESYRDGDVTIQTFAQCFNNL